MRWLGVAALVGLSAGGPSAATADDKKPAKPDRFDDIDPVAAKVDVPSLIRVRTEKDDSQPDDEHLPVLHVPPRNDLFLWLE